MAIIDVENNRQIPHRDHRFQAGEILVVEGKLDDLIRAKESLGIAIEAEHKLELSAFTGEDEVTIEAVLAPRSRITGKTFAGNPLP